MPVMYRYFVTELRDSVACPHWNLSEAVSGVLIDHPNGSGHSRNPEHELIESMEVIR